MISSASSTPSSGPINNQLSNLSSKPDARPQMLGDDQLELGKTNELRASLAAEPEVRSEVVERARALASDPSYPSTSILRSIASRLLQTPDFCESTE